MTLIEAVVAIALLGIIVAPIANLVIETGQSVNQSRLRLEAYNLATKTLESVENTANFGVLNYTKNTVSVTVGENGGNITQPFAVTTAYDLQTAGGQSLCTAAGAAVPAQIWKITVQVGWPGDNQAPAEEVTYIAPDQAGAIPATAGEMVVPVETAASIPALFTTQSVPVTVVGTYGGLPPTPVVPGTEFTEETVTTGNTGCAVFSNLDPGANWVYTVYLGTYNAGATPPDSFDAGAPFQITPQDLPGLVNGGSRTVTAPPQESGPTLVVGSPVLAGAFQVDPGTSVSVTWSTHGFPLIPAASGLPITAASSSLTANSFTFDTQGATTINSISLYPYSNYTLYAGDTADSNPNFTVGVTGVYPTAQPPVGVNATVAVSPVTLTAYPVVLTTAQALTATEAHSPSETVNLNPLLLGVSSTGLPLGQYTLSTGAGPTNWPDIWVTPTGVYYGTSVATTPSALPHFAAAGTAIAETP
jgi:Tfp pilus assembly protein PilV